MDLISDYGYSISDQSGAQRKKVLKKAIQDLSFDAVFDNLQDLVDELDGYKSERARQDLSYLVQNQHKYYTEKVDYTPQIRKIRRENVAES